MLLTEDFVGKYLELTRFQFRISDNSLLIVAL